MCHYKHQWWSQCSRTPNRATPWLGGTQKPEPAGSFLLRCISTSPGELTKRSPALDFTLYFSAVVEDPLHHTLVLCDWLEVDVGAIWSRSDVGDGLDVGGGWMPQASWLLCPEPGNDSCHCASSWLLSGSCWCDRSPHQQFSDHCSKSPAYPVGSADWVQAIPFSTISILNLGN